ncbi:MAG: hypothetical protein ACD_17C00048G0001, partial [uncultured bacterium]
LYLVEYYHYSNENAMHVYGFFSGFAAFMPFAGGWLADRWNYQSPLFLGALANALACFCIATGSHSLLYIALTMMSLGYALFTPSIITILGFSYHDKPHLRHAGFSLYYASINIGVFLALASMGTVAKLVNWEMAFVLAGFVQIIGLIPLTLYVVKHKEVYRQYKSRQAAPSKITYEQKDRMKVLGVYCVISLLFWISYMQCFSSMEIFVHQFMNKTVFSLPIPEGVFLSMESFFLLLLAPILATLYVRLKRDPSPAIKGVLSLYFMAAGFLLMAIGSTLIPSQATSANVSWGYVVGSYFLVACGEMLFAPIGLSLFSHLASRRFKAFSVGVFYGSIGVAFYMGGLLAGLMNSMGSLFYFFFLFVGITLAGALVMTFIQKWLTRKSHFQGSFD